MSDEDRKATQMENTENSIPNFVLAHSRYRVLNIIFSARTMPFDHMDNFIDVHDTRGAWCDEQEQQDCFENETHIEEAARQIVKVLREHRHGQRLEALPDDYASVVSLDAEQNVAEHDSLDSHEYAD